MSEYDRIREQCLSSGELWQDPLFPATQTSVFYHETPPFQFVWKRPTELCEEPHFIRDDHLDLNIGSGKLGDRWFVSCVGCLQTTRGLFYRVVPADQSFARHSYTGLFRFRIFWSGQWLEAVVDDRLPTLNGRLVFTHSLDGDVFWMSLLEKACAKLHGSYEALKYGSTLDGLADMTAGVTEIISLSGNDSDSDAPRVALLTRLMSHTSLVTAVVDIAASHTTSRNDKLEALSNGVVPGANYRVMQLLKVSTATGPVTLVRLHASVRPPAPYSGAWASPHLSCTCSSGTSASASCSSLWHTVSSSDRHKLALNQLDDQFEFWMDVHELWCCFSRLEMAHLDQETARDEPSLAGLAPWHVKVYQGVWRKGATAGGCRNNADTFHINPRLQLTLPDRSLPVPSACAPLSSSPCEQSDQVVVSLCQHKVTEPRVVGFSVYPTPSEPLLSQSLSSSSNSCAAAAAAARPPLALLLDASFFRQHKSIVSSQYTNGRQISQRCVLSCGASYVIVPTTYEPGEEAQFTLRVLSERAVRLRYIDLTSALLRDPVVKAPSCGVGKGFNQYEAVFQQLADEHRTVNVFELHELLEACLPNDYIKSCATLPVCRQVVFLMDSSGVGRLGFAQFKDLMCSLKLWQNIFQNHTKEKTGVLRTERFRDALSEAGVQLSTDVLCVLVQRYARKDGTLRFGDFVSALLQLCTAFDMIGRRHQLPSDVIKLTTSEWLRGALSC